ncbi:Uncharacterised protein g7850 [Pycnogonum litorale]
MRPYVCICFTAVLTFVVIFVIFISRLLFQDRDFGNIRLEIFYETLCPDSYSFIRNQLSEVYQNLDDECLSVKFIPYGKAVESIKDGKWSVTCHHGQRECEYNIIAACAFYGDVQNVTQRDYINFAVCMSHNSPGLLKTELEKCAIQHRLDWNRIKECSKNSSKNERIMKMMGELTRVHVPAFRTKLAVVPTVVLNEDAINGETINLAEEVCRRLKDKKLKYCDDYL